jgi:uncharacterized phage protein (TIGR02216 family)
MTARALDWPALLRAGLQTLRLKPAEFWALTPAELGLMLGLGGRTLPMSRSELDDLSRLYPDERTPQ